ncbi:MAG: FAD-binding protein [Vannielia sp.]|uniref:FAD-dependent oxidoreductase n=1 Tax=Vannielia sp. TaxID=2813045 RepID=UPI003B8AF1BB
MHVTQTIDCDLLVAGSGAAGLTAAVAAAHGGLKVVVAEKAEVIGGTTAWSGGWIWAPGNPVCAAGGTQEVPGAARDYLEAVQGNAFNAELVDAFLKAAPEMVGFFERETELRFDPGLKIPDTYSHQPGAGMGGRSVIAQPFDARRLGKALALLRKPMRETSFMGMTIQAGQDLRAFMTVLRSPRAAMYVANRMARHLWHLARHGRGMALRNGNALAGRLMRSALDLGVELRVQHALGSLETEGGAVVGARLAGPDGEVTVRARRGVVLACGGYPHDIARRNATFARPETHASLAVPEASGDGLRAGEAAGGRQTQALVAPAAMCPVSEVRWPDGTRGTFPHIIERGKPGVIGVLANGRRFCNEGLGYHDYVTALLEATAEGDTPESWLVCDHRFIRRYGLGITRPAPLPLAPWLRAGYLTRAATPEALAQACGIDPEGLAATIAQFNEGAARGEDPEFQRGTSAYMRLQGDPDHGPNPCLAPIEKGPFYAVRVIPGSFGTFAGLVTDGTARVLGPEGTPVPGLYAAGTDMASVMGGTYPAGGINLGPALTFGFIAGRHAAGGTT